MTTYTQRLAEQVANAKKELFAARERYFAAKSTPVKRAHAEEVQFWGGKLAALETMLQGSNSVE